MSEENAFRRAGRLQVVRILHGSLVAGCAIFAAVVVCLRERGNMPTREPPVLSFAGLVLAATVLVAVLVLPGVLAANWRKAAAQAETSAQGEALWWTLYQTRLIVLSALLEGTVFFLLLAYLLEGMGWSLVMAGLFGLSLVLLFPTRARVESWVRAQQELVEQQKNPPL